MCYTDNIKPLEVISVWQKRNHLFYLMMSVSTLNL